MISIFVLLVVVSTLLTAGLREYALRRSLLDIPNHRSSHEAPVPRGGGVAIVLIVMGFVFVAGMTDNLPRELFWAFAGGGSLIALIGWIDDHRDLSSSFRAIMQFIAAAWTVFCFGGIDSIQLGEGSFTLGFLGSILAIVLIVWLINLYNFMDGTDGIASVQALTAGGLGVFFFLTSGQIGAALLCLTLIASTSGFLLWNWAPAKIFMGDVGSSFIGYLFAVLALYGEKTGSVPGLVWAILLGGFFWDATLTLFKRMLNGERWYAAHRSHAYQRFVQSGYGHEQLAVRFLLLNVVVLWPLAYAAWAFPSWLFLLTVISMLLCSSLWLFIQNRYDTAQ